MKKLSEKNAYKVDKQFENVNQLIETVKWFLIVLLCIVALTELLKYPFCSCLSISCISVFFNVVANITKNTIPLLAALLATFAADRHIAFIDKNRNYDQAFEVTQIIHHHLAISYDLKDKISHLKKMFSDGGHYIHAFTTITESIEKRYESLLEKEAYKYLDGKTVMKINSMSGSVFALISVVSTLKEMPDAKSNQQLKPISFSPETFDKIIETIDLIVEDLVELKNNMLKEL